MDDTDQEQMQAERLERKESKRRDSAVSDNLALFEKLLVGENQGHFSFTVLSLTNLLTLEYCLRAKIDMASVNGTLRDPVLYRSNDTPHHRTLTKHK